MNKEQEFRLHIKKLIKRLNGEYPNKYNKWCLCSRPRLDSEMQT
jgi:hypothetical protein